MNTIQWNLMKDCPDEGTFFVLMEEPCHVHGSRIGIMRRHPNVTFVNGRFDYEGPEVTHFAYMGTPDAAGEFVPFDGRYVKAYYDALLPGGEVVEHCWPNAGVMCSCDGSGRVWEPDECSVRLSKTHPADGKPQIV